MATLIGLLIVLGGVSAQLPNNPVDFNFGDRINFTENDITSLPVLNECKEQLASFKDQVQEWNSEHIANITDEIAQFKRDMYLSLEIKLDIIRENIRELQKRDNVVDTLEEQVRKLKRRNEEIDTLLMRKLGVDASMVMDVSLTGQMASFEAVTSTDNLVAVTDYIKFDDVVYNIGGGYDVATGKFTSPHVGEYMFTVNVLSSANFNFDFLIDGAAVPMTDRVKINYPKEVSSSGKAKVRLQKDQEVVVRAKQVGEVLAGSSFTAKLLH